MQVNAASKLTKDSLDKNDDVGIFDDPVVQNRRVSVFDASNRTASSLFSSSSDSTPDDNCAIKGPKLSRRAVLEVPIAVSKENGLKIVPNARMSMHSNFSLFDKNGTHHHHQGGGGTWSGRLEATAVVRGYTGYTTQEAAVKYDANQKTALQTGFSAVRNRHKVFLDVKTFLGSNKHCSLSARYSQLAMPHPGAGAEVSLAANQGYSFGMLSSRCMIPFNSISPLRFSFSMVSKTVHRWNVSLGWNQLHNFSWNLGTDLLVREFQTLRLSIGQVRQGILALSGTFAQKIRDKMTFNVAVSYNASRGTLWILSWSNGDFCLNVPISLLDFQDVWTSMALTALSKVVQEAVAFTLRLDKLTAESTALERSILDEKQQRARSEALNQQDLMRRQAQSRANAEKEKSGLIIMNAVYQTPDARKSLDVTVPLQFWVMDGSLELPAGSKKHLLGFYDVGINQGKDKRKSHMEVDSEWSTKWWTGFFQIPQRTATANAAKPVLVVTYEFKGRRDKVNFRDDEKLVLPR